ncbi:hypothetical protein Pelo_8891 [Pelomyxa schiedti]|nr:hypothetical protein Pelo_8891 [Pelomyxa schiedti]
MGQSQATTTTNTSSPHRGPQQARVGPSRWFSAAEYSAINVGSLQVLLDRDPGILNSINNKHQRLTALHVATWAQSQKGVEFLLSMNIDVNAQMVCNIPS